MCAQNQCLGIKIIIILGQFGFYHKTSGGGGGLPNKCMPGTLKSLIIIIKGAVWKDSKRILQCFVWLCVCVCVRVGGSEKETERTALLVAQLGSPLLSQRAAF